MYGRHAASAPEVVTRTDGETSVTWTVYVITCLGARLPCKVRGRPLFVAAEEAAYMYRRLWSSPDPGPTWDKRSYLGSRVLEAGSPRVVSPLDEHPDPNLGMHAEY